jgi:Rhodanese-like domain
MRSIVAALAISVLTAAVAQAQYKQAPAPAPPAVNPNGGTVQIIPQTPQQPQLQPQAESPLESARRISREEATKMVAEHKAVYVDVRSKEQYDISHIKGAISIPLSELPNRWKDLPVGKFLITYCA